MNKKNIFVYFFAFLFVSAFKLNAGEPQYSHFFFDAGSINTHKNEFAVKITKDDIYNENIGYGWLENNYEEFVSEDYRRRSIRDELTYDGIKAKEINFKINLEKGDWWFTFWVETGYEHVATTKLFINDNFHPLVWHELKPGAEDIPSQLANYRVIHTKVSVSENGLTFRLTGESDFIYLMGFSFINSEQVKKDVDESILKIVKRAGKYKSSVILSDLASALEGRYRENRSNNFYFYWYQQSKLFAEAERYQNTMGWEWSRQLIGLSIFDRMHQALFLLDSQIENFDTSNYLFKERALWNRGKISYDLVLERGGDYQKQIYENDLPKLLMWYPNDDNLAMLNGKKISRPHHCDNLPSYSNSPNWALLQREAICRLSSEIDWWIYERQDPHGELGGKIGDDVEILREWTPLLFLGDYNTRVGWRKLAGAVWEDSKVYRGFSARPIDVEHASEFISDSTPELLLLNHDSKVKEILTYTAEYFENLWTFRNDYGRRYFKSSWYSSTEVVETPPKNRDLGYNTRTAKPLNYLAWTSRNSDYIKLLKEWADGWHFAAMSTDKNKPIGIIPASIRYYDESINGDENTWYKANMYWTYFDWQHDAGTMILDQLLFTYTITNDEKYLQPIEYALGLVEKYKDQLGIPANFEEGSETWVASTIIRKNSFWNVVQRWRILTGNNKYDELIDYFGNPYIKYVLTKDEKFLEKTLQSLLDQLRYNVPLRTTLVVHTDRVRINGTDDLKAMITGDGGSGNSPYFAVTWEKAEKDIAILVEESSSEYLHVKVFSFDDTKKEIIAKPWALERGSYKVILEEPEQTRSEEIIISNQGQDTPLIISPKILTSIKFIKN